jgi:hypothetical protein
MGALLVFGFGIAFYVWLFKALMKHNPEATKGFLKAVGAMLIRFLNT